MTKEVTFGSRPKAKATKPETLEEWAGDEPKKKRITFDVPPELHGRIKAVSAIRGVTIKDLVIELLEREFPKGGKA